MSNKNLLNEGQVRQFMKLARLEPLTPGFVHGLTEKQGAVDKEDEHLGAKDGPERDKKQSMKDRRKDMRGEDRAEGEDPAAVEESHGRGRGEGDAGYGRPDNNTRLEEEAPPEELENFAADDLADDSLEGDEEAAHDELEVGAELDDVDGGRMVSVDDFLAALESALETAMGDEVEVDASEMADEEVPVEDEIEVDDVEVEDDLMQETADEEVTTEATDEEVTTEATDDLVEQITKRVAARILKSALTKKQK